MNLRINYEIKEPIISKYIYDDVFKYTVRITNSGQIHDKIFAFETCHKDIRIITDYSVHKEFNNEIPEFIIKNGNSNVWPSNYATILSNSLIRKAAKTTWFYSGNQLYIVLIPINNTNYFFPINSSGLSIINEPKS